MDLQVYFCVLPFHPKAPFFVQLWGFDRLSVCLCVMILQLKAFLSVDVSQNLLGSVSVVSHKELDALRVDVIGA